METEKRQKAQELAQHKTVKAKVQTVDFNDEYAGITPDEITLQTDSSVKYEHHSQFWNQNIDQQTAELEKTIADEDASEKKTNEVYGTTDALNDEKFKSAAERDADEQKTHHKTVDLEEVYDGMTVQLDDHSKYWENRVSSAQNQLEEIMAKQEEPAYSQENTSIDQNELYNGMAVQLSADHSQYYENRVASAQKQLEEIMAEQEKPVYSQENTSIDQNELYDGLAVQTADSADHHSQYWESRVSSAQQQLEELMRKQDEPVYSQENTSIDQNELYNGMAVQIGDMYDIHSKFWYNEQSRLQKEVDQEDEAAEVMALEQRYSSVPEVESIHQSTIDQSELYDGLAVQLGGADLHSKNWYIEQEQAEKNFNMQAQNGEPQAATHHDTIDQGELYNGMAVQLGGADLHSKNWYNEQEKTEKYFNMQAQNGEPQAWNPTSHVSTIDQGELYNGLAVQLGGIHSANYEATMAAQDKAVDAEDAKREEEMTPAEREAIRKENAPVFVTDNHIVATSLIPEHRNYDLDTSIYNGLSALNNNYVQLADHDDDQDDIVPELSYDVKPAEEEKLVEQKHFDFDGAEFKETYDD